MPFIAPPSTETIDILSGRNIEVYTSIDSTDNKNILKSLKSYKKS